MVDKPRAPAPALSITAIGARSRGAGGAVGHRAGQRVDPVYFAEQPDNLAEGKQRADRQHAKNEAVQPGIGAEGDRDLLIEDENEESDQGQERRHPHQENTRGSQ